MSSNLYENEEKILNLETRKKIFQKIKQFAGVHFRELERITELPSGTVRYNLNYLKKHNLIKEENQRYYTKEFQENKAIMNLLRQKNLRRILVYLLDKPRNHDELVKILKISPSTVSWHLKKLEDIIVREKIGKNTCFKIKNNKEEIINLLIIYKETFFDSLIENIIDMWEV